jgi:hypothetical protein
MSQYLVKFITSGIVAARFTERSMAVAWMDANNYAPDVPDVDPDTGELTGHWHQRECLGLFTIERVKNVAV